MNLNMVVELFTAELLMCTGSLLIAGAITATIVVINAGKLEGENMAKPKLLSCQLKGGSHNPDLQGVCSICKDVVESIPRAPSSFATPDDHKGNQAQYYDYYYNPDGIR